MAHRQTRLASPDAVARSSSLREGDTHLYWHDRRRSAVRRRRLDRVKGVAMVVGGLMATKAAMFCLSGPVDYVRRLEDLRLSESAFDRLMALLLTPDPLTLAAARFLEVLPG